MASIEIKVNSDDAFKSIDTLTDALLDLSEPFSEFGEYYRNRLEIDEFGDEKDPYGMPWAPLSAATLAMKQKKRQINKTLQATGIMRSTIAYQADADGVLIGFGSTIAQYHQYGTTKMPKRELLPNEQQGLPIEDEEKLTQLIAEHLNS